jgi:pyruvate formate lyase activating enzyme
MLIGGLQKSSCIDYPGKLSCVLFLAGCNFDCPYCHNPDLVRSDRSRLIHLNEQTVIDFLGQRRGFLDGVVISGGEPTLHPELLALCRRIKSQGYALKLDTNGSRPRVISRLIDDGLIDYIAMDIKADPVQYPSCITRADVIPLLLASIDAIMGSSLPYEFRTTCVRPLVDEHTVSRIAQIIAGAERYVLQRFHTTPVLHPDFFQNQRPELTETEMVHLRNIAAPLVTTCLIR